jgi:site-specific recombinase XerD
MKMKKSNVEAVAIARHIYEFLNTYAPIHKTTSVHTLKSYHIALTLYIGYLETEKGITSAGFNVKCFDRPMVEDWLHWLSVCRRCAPETCNVRLSSLRVFLEYLGSRDIRYLSVSSGASAIPLRKTQKRKVLGLSRDALKALMAAPDTSKKSGRRDLALLIALYGTAARIDEILSMKVGQLQLDSNRPFATVIGKGNKVRTLYLPLKAAAHLNKYIAEAHGDEPDPEAIVFYSRNVGAKGKLTQAAISKVLKKHALTAHEACQEVPLDLHAHRLRHAKASHWLEDGVNIVQISFLLGHENLQTTMVYLAISKEQEIKALATLEDENDAGVVPKWKNESGSLSELCGLTPIKG